MSKTGRITLPAELRRSLRLEDEAEFEVEHVEGKDRIVLRPVVVVRREEAWVYTADMLASIQRGLQDLKEGRERSASEADFRALAEVEAD